MLSQSTAMPAKAQQTDASTPLSEEAFRNPPPEARPRVWWHWLNGNVTTDGITSDLEWMSQIGIGGVQTFDINFQTPDVVDQRLHYMTTQWRGAFRFAAREANRLGLELTIASSPGWSLTGGPWVAPEDGMKKLVWSSTLVNGADVQALALPVPPSVSGPFQEIPLKPEPGADPDHVTPQAYGDIAVLAFPAPPLTSLPIPQYNLHDGTAVDPVLMTDGTMLESAEIRRDEAGGAAITMTYDAPQTVRSLVAYMPGTADMFTGAALDMVLESSDDGAEWRTAAHFKPTLVPSTVAFDPVTARLFRLRMTAINTLSPIDRLSAPGYAGINYSLYLQQMPFRVAELRLQAAPAIDQFETKAGFAVVPDFYSLEANSNPQEAGVAPSQVIDLSDRLRADGTLDWQPPTGNWRIVRLGWSLTGKTNHPAPAEATGLEVDKLDGAAVRRYMRTYLDSYRAAVGPELIGNHGINAVLTDSTEVGAFNWTPALEAEFARRRGYALRPWLPALTGTVIGSRAQSDNFLYDFRRTIAEMHASEHYGAVAQVAHEAGLSVYGEALEGWRVSLGDDIDMRGFTDIPMAAMWAFPEGVGPRPLLVADLRTAAASAHLRGRTLVAAESMTSSRFPWAMGPAELRRVVDTEFANGINRIVIHTSPHQPVDNLRPGLSLRHIGQFFTRHETWAGMARPWIDYLARNSYLLQRGQFVADVAYFSGEDAPAPTLVGQGRLNDLPRHYGYDFVNASAVLNLLRADGGNLMADGGARYHILYLGGTSERITLPVLRRLQELASAGATIVGMPPLASPSLADDHEEFRALVQSMWAGGDQTNIGSGRVIASHDPEQALSALGIGQDFAVTSGGEHLAFVHRAMTDADLYYVHNSGEELQVVEARFRVTGKAPELWDAVTGTISPLPYRIEGNETVVPLSLDAEKSLFVVFRRDALTPALVLPRTRDIELGTVGAEWTIAFEPGRGAPVGVTLANLTPLNHHPDPAIRYFSGVATYRTDFTAPSQIAAMGEVILDLGQVGDMAEVLVNGQPAGTVWQAPYRIRVTGLVHEGQNQLEVRVANLWANRLIGDVQPGASPIGWTSVPMYRADAPLRPSGLIGPVVLINRAYEH